MKNILILIALFFSICLSAQKKIAIDFQSLSKASISSERFDNAKSNFQFNIIEIPMPNGEVIDFAVKHSPLVSKDNPLYEGPAGQTYSIHSPVTPGYNGSFILYKNGIHATLNTPDGLLFIKRENTEGQNDNHIFTYFKDTNGFPHSAHDAVKTHLPTDKGGKKHSHDGEEEHVHEMPSFLQANNNFFTVGAGNTRKTLDLFIVSDKSFVDQYSGNTTNATNRVTEVVNGVKAVWEQDFNITINYMGVYFDPIHVNAEINGSKAIWGRVTDANIPGATKNEVDLVHFMAGNGGPMGGPGGGAGGLWVACGASKDEGYSGVPNVADASFIPLVAHEMAHQMGADHTWTGSDQSCTTGQWGKNSGVEPGAGVTLAGYAGICGTDNIPGGGKGNYHHIESLREIVTYANSGMGKNAGQTTITAAGQIPEYSINYGQPSCITSSTYNNNIPIASVDNIFNNYLPTNTPFELNGSATDGDNDPLTYQWDQLDFALVQQPLDGYASRADGPLFRSYGPKSKTKREFPKLEDILSNTQVKGEILPQVARSMRFAFMVRDGKGGVGVDTIGLQVVNTGSAFSITESINVSNPSIVTVNWNVANTTAAPISCANVDILYSVDGGETFPHTLVGPTPNDGSHIVDLSSFGNTANGRIKIKGTNRVFFDINNSNLSVGPAGCAAQSSEICGPVTVSAESGNNSLDLDENKHIIGAQSSTSKTVTVSNTQGASITDNGGNCGETNFSDHHGTFEFTVSTTGTYTITGPQNSIISILETSGYTYDSSNPCNNSGTFLGSNFTSAGSGQALSPSLTACTTYTAVVSGTAAGSSITVSFSGPGNIISSIPSAAGTSYTYIAVNNADSQIKKVDSGADFKSLTSGSYKVYGVSYLSSINTASWVGMTTAQALSTSTCAFKSTNHHTLTVTGGSCGITSAGLTNIQCNQNGTTVSTADDYITFSLNPTATGNASMYNVSVSSGSVSPTSASFGSAANFQLQDGSAGGGNVTITVTDATTNTCTTTAVITDPGICSTGSGDCMANANTDVKQSDLAADKTIHNGTITSGAAAPNGVNVSVNNVTFKAQNSINLNGEFQVTSGNVFNAVIEDCPGGSGGAALQNEKKENVGESEDE